VDSDLLHQGRKLGQTTTPPQYFDYLIELALKHAK
jgi:hypothetical protein